MCYTCETGVSGSDVLASDVWSVKLPSSELSQLFLFTWIGYCELSAVHYVVMLLTWEHSRWLIWVLHYYEGDFYCWAACVTLQCDCLVQPQEAVLLYTVSSLWHWYSPQMWVTKHTTLHLFITLANSGRFQQFWLCWTQQEICNNVDVARLHNLAIYWQDCVKGA